IPDILILIFIGLFLGPILATYFDYEIIASSTIETIAPYFAALALVIILFDAGLNLNLEKTMQKLGPAILHTGIAFMGTMFTTAFICYYLLGLSNVIIGLLLGCVLGGVSSAIVIPIMTGVNAKDDTKVLLTLESVISDVLCIVTALILIEILKGGNAEPGVLIQHLLSAFVLAGFIAFLFGVFWLAILKRLEGKSFSFMITIAALLVLYAATEYIQVSGAIAALVFGLVLSNKDEIARILKIRGSFVFDEHIKQFHSEVSFLVKTFFFVYLGLTFTFTIGVGTFVYGPMFYLPSVFTDNPLVLFTLVLLVLFIGFLIIRYIAASVTCVMDKDLKSDKPYIYTMLPRGLAAAVLAQLPFSIPEFRDYVSLGTQGYYDMMVPHQNLYLNMAFMMIVLTVIATTIGVSLIERWKRKAEEQGKADAKSDDWAQRSKVYKKHVEAKGKKEEPSKWKLRSRIPEKESKRKPKEVKRRHPPSQKPATKPP
ncbi:MAG: cation:proton antiporter, partial [Thermoplasmata archaeon]|nr:cation:proton antiporter [Thermoplasmata archaeon]